VRAAGILALRRERPADAAFVARLYASTRADELAPFGLSEAQLAAFLAQQHAALREREGRDHAGADVELVLVDEEPVGRLVVARAGAAPTDRATPVPSAPAAPGRAVRTDRAAAVPGAPAAPAPTRILDFALLPAWRGGGIGTALLRALCVEADAAARPIAVALGRDSAALTLFARHGFVPRATSAVHMQLIRPAAERSQAVPSSGR
jgi:GNAT superfamily N-acetyltransferase